MQAVPDPRVPYNKKQEFFDIIITTATTAVITVGKLEPNFNASLLYTCRLVIKFQPVQNRIFHVQ